jgi:hypothetical protein
MPKLGFLSNRQRFPHIGLFCDVQQNFCNVLGEGGWSEKMLRAGYVSNEWMCD